MDNHTETERIFRASSQRIIYAHKLAKILLAYLKQPNTPTRRRTLLNRYSKVTSWLFHAKHS